MRDPRYDILFEPVKIGPLTAKNRFYQVPHCNGGGYRDPSAAAEMRGIKAEGGWGVIFTEQCEMHHTSSRNLKSSLESYCRRDQSPTAHIVARLPQCVRASPLTRSVV